MEYYIGNNLDDIYGLVNECYPDSLQPLTCEELNKIYSALKVTKLPKLYEKFLLTAGKYFRPWNGLDYKLLDDEGNFINYSHDITDDEELVERFEKYGFDFDDCVFFVGNGGFIFYFFRKDDEDDDPLVYSIDCVTVEDLPYEPMRFSELVISTYNEMVAYKKKDEDPWIESSSLTAVTEWIENNFPFKNVSTCTLKTDKYARYSIRHTADENCLKYFTPILKKLITESNSVYVYSNKKLYIYVPEKDKLMDNKMGLNIYKDRVAVVDRNKEWGWFSINGSVYIYGEVFIRKIRDNFELFSLKDYISGTI